MTLLTFKNPMTGEQMAADEEHAQGFLDAGWEQISEGIPVDDLQRVKRGEVDVYLARQFAAGFTPSSGPLAGHTLQVRGVEDRTNWLTSQAAYLAAVSQGAGAVMGADFRTETNETVTVSYADGLNALLAMAAWGKTIFGKSWELKDKLQTLSAAELEAFDVEAEWSAI